MTEGLQLLVIGLITGSILATSSVGLTMVYGQLHVWNFAWGAYISVGAYATYALNVEHGVPFAVAAVLGIAITAIMSVAFDFGIWRPLRARGAQSLALFLTSIGLALVLSNLILIFWGGESRKFDVDVFQAYSVGGIRISRSAIISMIIVVAAALLLSQVLRRTMLGKSIRAIANSRELAASAGVNVERITLVIWGLAGALAGLAGVLLGLAQNSFSPSTGPTILIYTFAAVTLGGVGDVTGGFYAGILLGVVVELSTWSVLPGGGVPISYQPVVAFAVLTAILLWRPSGLLGKAQVL